MSRTTYLNLTLTDSDQLLFKDWRNIINGPDSSSNTQILDAFAGRFAAGTQGQVLVKKDSVNFNFEWRKLSTSELTNDSGFITKAVNDLSNYYDKTIVDTKLKDVLDQTLHIQIVQKLPEVPSTRVIYLVPSADPGEKNYYNEYIYIKKPDGTYAWELIGTTKIDLTNYYTKTQVDTLLAGKQTVIDTSNKLTSDLVTDENQTNKFVTSTEKTAWNNKVDKTSTANRVYGTDASGAQTTFDKESFGQVDDVKISRNGEAVSIVENKIATIIYETGLGTDSDNAATVTAIRAFVNSSIEAVAANYITSNSDGDAFSTRALLISGPWYYAGQLKTPTRNDYAVVIADEAHGGQSARYTYTKDEGATTGQWSFQYPFNMTFTQAQINALNSGITAAKVELYDAHLLNTNNPHNVTKAQVGLDNVDNKSEATIKTDFTGSITSENTGFVTGGDAYTALQGKQETIDNTHKLSSDLVDDTNHSNKFVTETQRSALANAITNNGIGTCTSEIITVSVWNGDYTGFTKYGYTSNYVVKMSNDPIAYESLLGKTLGYKFSEANTLTLSAENTFVDTTDPNVITAWDVEYGAPILYSVFADTTAIFDDITVPRGLYFVWMTHPDFENPPWYTTSLTGLSWTQTIEEVNQIANKFIPLSAGNGIKYYDGVISFNGNDIIDEGKFTVLGVQERIDTPYGTLVEASEDQHYVDQNIQMGFSSGVGKSFKLKSLNKLTDYNDTPLVSGNNDGTNWTSLTLDGVTKNIPSGGALPTTANAGDAMIYKGNSWEKQSGYGYTDDSHQFVSFEWDGKSITGKPTADVYRPDWEHEGQFIKVNTLYKISDYCPSAQEIIGAYVKLPNTIHNDSGYYTLEGSIQLITPISTFGITENGYVILPNGYNGDYQNYPTIAVCTKVGTYSYTGDGTTKIEFPAVGIYSATADNTVNPEIWGDPKQAYLSKFINDKTAKLDQKLSLPVISPTSRYIEGVTDEEEEGLENTVLGYANGKWNPIPQLAHNSTNITFSYSWDGNTTGKEALIIDGITYYKIADKPNVDVKFNKYLKRLTKDTGLVARQWGSSETFVTDQYTYYTPDTLNLAAVIMSGVGILLNESGHLKYTEDEFTTIDITGSPGIYITTDFERLEVRIDNNDLKTIPFALLPFEEGSVAKAIDDKYYFTCYYSEKQLYKETEQFKIYKVSAYSPNKEWLYLEWLQLKCWSYLRPDSKYIQYNLSDFSVIEGTDDKAYQYTEAESNSSIIFVFDSTTIEGTTYTQGVYFTYVKSTSKYLDCIHIYEPGYFTHIERDYLPQTPILEVTLDKIDTEQLTQGKVVIIPSQTDKEILESLDIETIHIKLTDEVLAVVDFDTPDIYIKRNSIKNIKTSDETSTATCYEFSCDYESLGANTLKPRNFGLQTGLYFYTATGSVYSEFNKKIILNSYSSKNLIHTVGLNGKQTIAVDENATDTPLCLKSGKAASYLQFADKNNNELGYLGINANKKPVFYDTTDHKILLQEDVVANPTLAGTESNLTGLQVGGTKYKVPSGDAFVIELTLNPEYQEEGAYFYISTQSAQDVIDAIVAKKAIILRTVENYFLCTYVVQTDENAYELRAFSNSSNAYIGSSLIRGVVRLNETPNIGFYEELNYEYAPGIGIELGGWAGTLISVDADSTPTSGSAKPVTSGGVYTALAGKSAVSGTNDGTNWTTLTIEGVSKNIPSGGGGSIAGIAVGEGTNSLVYNDTTNNTATGENANASGDSTIKVPAAVKIKSTADIIADWSARGDNKYSLAKGNNSTVEGSNNLALEKNAHAEGNGTIAANNSAHSEGTGTQALGKYSHAEGLETKASANCAHSEGYQTEVTGLDGAHAEGKYTKAAGNYSHAEGYQTIANNESSHAEGYNTKAYGSGSHSEGQDTIAYQRGQHAEGVGTLCSNLPADESQHVAGFYNVQKSGARLTGNGTSSNRKNIEELDWSGNLMITGNLKAAGLTDGTTTKTMSQMLAGATINDTTPSASTTYSSQKIETIVGNIESLLSAI